MSVFRVILVVFGIHHLVLLAAVSWHSNVNLIFYFLLIIIIIIIIIIHDVVRVTQKIVHHMVRQKIV